MDLRLGPKQLENRRGLAPQDAVERQGYRLGRSIQSTKSRPSGWTLPLCWHWRWGDGDRDTTLHGREFSDDQNCRKRVRGFDVTSNWVMPLRQGGVFRGGQCDLRALSLRA